MESQEKLQKEFPSKLLPKGAIVSWHGSTKETPKGWALCDGNNTTPDLRNRFIIGGGDKYDIGQKGGSSFIVLDKSNLPKLGKGYFISHLGSYNHRTDEVIKFHNGYYKLKIDGWGGDDAWFADIKGEGDTPAFGYFGPA